MQSRILGFFTQGIKKSHNVTQRSVSVFVDDQEYFSHTDL